MTSTPPGVTLARCARRGLGSAARCRNSWRFPAIPRRSCPVQAPPRGRCRERTCSVLHAQPTGQVFRRRQHCGAVHAGDVHGGMQLGERKGCDRVAAGQVEDAERLVLSGSDPGSLPQLATVDNTGSIVALEPGELLPGHRTPEGHPGAAGMEDILKEVGVGLFQHPAPDVTAPPGDEKGRRRGRERGRPSVLVSKPSRHRYSRSKVMPAAVEAHASATAWRGRPIRQRREDVQP